MSGALAERVFAHKLEKVGFADLAVVERRSFGLEDAARYPLFTPELISLMEQLLGPDQRSEVAVAVTLTARKPTEEERR